MRKLCFALVVTLMAACFAGGIDQANLGSVAGTTRTVTGTQIGHYKNGPLGVDLSVVTVAANVPSGHGYTVINGSGTSSGTFSIPNVPTGFYLLQLGNIYLWTKNTVVDADFDADYRSDGVLAGQNTMVTFDLANLNAWQSTDVFEVVCPNNTTYDTFPGTSGETAFTGTFPYFGFLSDASKGDQYYISQLITQNVGGFPFTASGRYTAPPKFTQQQGSDTPINGRLKTIRQTHKFEANINGADLTAQTLAANPNAVLVDTAIVLSVYPGSQAKGQNTSTPDLILYSAVTGLFITSNGDLGPVQYGNPFPSSKWPLYTGYVYYAGTKYVAPGATNGTHILSLVNDATPTLPTRKNPMKPLVGVVTKPSINGTAFFQDQTGVGATPLLKWSPPSVGTPTYYVVQVFQLTNNGGNTVKTLIAGLRTQHTSLRIPPGVLTAGPGYVFRIRPWYVPGLNFVKAPFRYGPTSAIADVVSGLMQP